MTRSKSLDVQHFENQRLPDLIYILSVIDINEQPASHSTTHMSNLDTLVLCTNNYQFLATPKQLDWSLNSSGTFSLF
jgi:hypothetical protein